MLVRHCLHSFKRNGHTLSLGQVDIYYTWIFRLQALDTLPPFLVLGSCLKNMLTLEIIFLLSEACILVLNFNENHSVN